MYNICFPWCAQGITPAFESRQVNAMVYIHLSNLKTRSSYTLISHSVIYTSNKNPNLFEMNLAVRKCCFQVKKTPVFNKWILVGKINIQFVDNTH